MKHRYSFCVNGLNVQAEYGEREEQEVFLPLLRHLSALQRERGRRICAFLAGPPAAGKSTLCCYLEKLSRSEGDLLPVQTVGIDGFHYPQAYLNEHGLAGIKGAPETYDVEKFCALLERLDAPNQRWPIYDRCIHDPVEGAVEIWANIVIVEGNWLLLKEPPWSGLSCDYSIFLRTGERFQLERIVARKVQGGYSEGEARSFAERNDWPNIQKCMNNSRRADLNLGRAADGNWEEI